MKHCAYPWQQMLIDLTGEVVPCCYWSGYGNTGQPLGNTNEKSIEEIWNDKPYRELRAAWTKETLDGHPCGNCMSYRWSNGKFPDFEWPTTITNEAGFCFLTRVSSELSLKCSQSKNPLSLVENGVVLSNSDSVHDEIRNKGEGRFSLSSDYLYFSSSDNTDPNLNGRSYALLVDNDEYIFAVGQHDTKASKNAQTAQNDYMTKAHVSQAKPSLISLIHQQISGLGTYLLPIQVEKQPQIQVPLQHVKSLKKLHLLQLHYLHP